MIYEHQDFLSLFRLYFQLNTERYSFAIVFADSFLDTESIILASAIFSSQKF